MEENNIAKLIVHPNYAKRISSEINTQKSERIINNIKVIKVYYYYISKYYLLIIQDN